MGVILRFEIRRIVRSPTLVVAIAVWVAAALAATWNGARVIERQEHQLAASDQVQRAQHEAVLELLPPTASAGDQLYYLTHHTRHHPSTWAPLSVGQRDLRSFNIKLRLLALHGQLYDGDIVSPLLAALGTFDLAFVLVALAPLLVVALCHDVVSGEREAGTWPLVKSQSTAPLAVLAAKVTARYVVLLVTIAGVVVVAPLLVGAAWDLRVLAVVATLALYLLLWVTLATAVATFGYGSDVNALVLLGAWVLAVIVGPALVMVTGAAKFPTPEALELTVAQREGYHAAWDRPVAETMAPFLARHPGWDDVPVPTNRYSTAWYYAMQQRGDDQAAPAASAYTAALAARHAWVQRGLMFFPPAALQAGFDRIARTDLPAHLAYLGSVASFHAALTRHFLPVMFREPTLAQVDWSGTPRHDHRDEGAAGDLIRPWPSLAAWLALALAVVWTRQTHL